MEIVVPAEFQFLYEVSASRPVVKIPAEVLKKQCAPVTKVTKSTQQFIDHMVKCMDMANGIGLAAPQLGKLERIIVIAPGDTKPLALINPVLTEAEGEQIGQEGCLSIPGLYGDVLRAERVVVEALDVRGKPVTYEMEGLAARVVQHEIDHLDGILFIEKVDPATLHWMNPEEFDAE